MPFQKKSPLYKPLKQITVRVPLLPIESYLSLATRPITYTELDDRIKYAIMVGSENLASALSRTTTNRKDLQKDQSKLLRYLIRMSSRCTPYGLFAGIAMGNLGQATTLALADRVPRTHTRPDMEWLLKFVNKMERADEVLRRLNVRINPTAFIRGGRLYLSERFSSGEDTTEPRVSIRATSIVRQVLEFVVQPVMYETLMEKLHSANPSAGKEKIDRLLKELLSQTILTTELRPPLTTANPAEYVLQVLSPNPAARTYSEQLRTFLDRIRECDTSTCAEGIRLFARLKQAAEGTDVKTNKPVVQVDCERVLSGSILTQQVGDEVARAAETILAISPYPKGYNPLTKYYTSFMERYGTDRRVNLLELLDPNFGLGIPAEYTGDMAGSTQRLALDTRDKLLLKLATDAIRDKKLVIRLDDELIDKLKTGTPKTENSPTSLDICAFVAAKTPADIDAGKFDVVIAPSVGANSAGKMLGRFAHVIGKTAYATLQTLADTERRHAPDKLFAELVYLPRKYRSGNVAVRPSIHAHEIVLGVAPSVAPEKVIPIHELVVGADNGHLHLYWAKTNQELYIADGHMLNTYGAPAICRFLSDIGKPAYIGFTNFDWGPAANLPFLPRIQVGKTALTIAEWRISSVSFSKDSVKSTAQFIEEFKKWQEAWSVPRYIYLSNGDNRLLLDTQYTSHIEEIRTEVARTHTVIIQEAYPGPEHAWVPGLDGHYLMEVVVSLVSKTISKASDGETTKSVPAAPTSHNFFERLLKKPAIPPERLCPPGGDWLFIKLYCGRELEEDLLLECRSFCARMEVKGYAEDYFFIRYSDPEPHIRLRFHGNSKRLTAKLYPELCTWATDMQAQSRCLKFAYDTYDREIERYGGPEAICLAEKLFSADSEFVLDWLHLRKNIKDGPERLIVAVGSIHQLLADMGLDDRARIDWCNEYDDLWDTVAELYRKEQKQLRSVISDTAQALGQDIEQLLAQRRKKLTVIARYYNDLSQKGNLGIKYGSILRSIVHMHCNRFLGTDNTEELKALALLSRALHSLAAMKNGNASRSA